MHSSSSPFVPRRLPFILALCAAAATPGVAQQPATQHADSAAAQQATLTLSEAIRLARANNPDFQVTKNGESDADWAVREAYGKLLPGANISTSFQYQGSGTPQIGIYTGSDFGFAKAPAYYYSNYQFGLNYSLSGASLFAPGEQKANRRAVVANIDASEFQLVSDVTRQYLAVLRARDQVDLAEQQLREAEENYKLADARVRVGSAIRIEAQQAEVDRGRAQVALLQARNAAETEHLRLSQQLGVDLPADVQLVSSFEVAPLPWTEQQLVQTAMSKHPALVAVKAQRNAASAGVKAAKTSYLPTLQMSVGWSGNTRQAANEDYLLTQARQSAQSSISQCNLLNEISAGLSSPLEGTPADCTALALTPAQEQQILAGNRAFPFNYSKQPMFAQLSISLPIFSGFTRERQLEQAHVQEQDAKEKVRSEELKIRTAVASAFRALETARQTVGIEARNREVAGEQLKLERERYSVGSSNFLQLQQAETLKAKADQAYLDATYSYHQDLADLENAVGQRLRTNTEGH